MPSTATGARTRQALAVVNGVADLPPTSGPPSSAGSDSEIIEFSKEDIEALLTEKLKTKNKYNTKVSGWIIFQINGNIGMNVVVVLVTL